MAEEEGEAPTLKLIMEKGPRAGETLTFDSNSKTKIIKIGRVVRGNTVAIKDAGISTKHLSISLSPSSAATWHLTDSDSSNGTFLNSSLLPPHAPFPLSHGDSIKIGEVTLIRVIIIGGEDDDVADRKKDTYPPRGTRRGELGRGQIGELVDDVAGKKAAKKTRGRATTKGDPENLEKIGEDEELGLGVDLGKDDDVAAVEGKRKPRGRPKKEEELESQQVSTRRTRSSKNQVASSSNKNEEQEVRIADKVVGKMTTGVSRRNRELRALGLEKNEAEIEPELQVSTRRTRRMKVEPESSFRADVAAPIVDKVNQRGKRGNKKNDGELNLGKGGEGKGDGNVVNVRSGGSGNGSISEKITVKIEHCDSFCELGNFGNNLVSTKIIQGEDNLRIVGETEGEVNLENEQPLEKDREYVDTSILGQDVYVPDLEKMTLGEWFDYLDTHIPKAIHDETEELIAEMFKKADKFREFVSEHEKDKEKRKLCMV